ncbi:AAA family ATPase [Leptospira jelokensis]|uniref:AAA family ATPase n=1 Tax=Leptospira jelokensis TaxID=2484931 RepID=UPI001090B3B9|nr:AAA family ATPase [Leptospira jelokensis]TGM05276.1 ATPase [Leptospira jelokensis]
MIHGLVLGKFYPPHKGHLHLIKEAKKKCDLLTVLICSLEREIIPGELRFEWMKGLIPDPNIKLVWVKDENPQYPEDHPNFWEIWKQTITSHSKLPIDFVFTSELYGDPLASVLGCQHIPIDLKRKHVPISASKIRENPIQYWEYIPEPIRSYFVKRIVLTGSESVGKTTLTKKLANHFETNWIPEFARQYLEEKPTPMDESDFLPIAKGHLLSEIEAAKNSNGILFLDTDLLTTKVYLERYYRSDIPWLTERALGLQYDASLFLDIDIPWEKDKLRDLGDEREEMKTRFLQAMAEAKRDFFMIKGNFLEREKLAIDYVNQIKKWPIHPISFTKEQIALRKIQ